MILMLSLQQAYDVGEYYSQIADGRLPLRNSGLPKATQSAHGQKKDSNQELTNSQCSFIAIKLSRIPWVGFYMQESSRTLNSKIIYGVKSMLISSLLVLYFIKVRDHNGKHRKEVGKVITSVHNYLMATGIFLPPHPPGCFVHVHSCIQSDKVLFLAYAEVLKKREIFAANLQIYCCIFSTDFR